GNNTRTATATDLAGNTGVGSTSFTVSVTTGSLCLLTKKFLQDSSNYATLTASQTTFLDSAANALCQKLAAITPHLTPTQRTALLSAYKIGVQALVPPGWLTQAQATTLIGLANKL